MDPLCAQTGQTLAKMAKNENGLKIGENHPHGPHGSKFGPNRSNRTIGINKWEAKPKQIKQTKTGKKGSK